MVGQPQYYFQKRRPRTLSDVCDQFQYCTKASTRYLHQHRNYNHNKSDTVLVGVVTQWEIVPYEIWKIAVVWTP